MSRRNPEPVLPSVLDRLLDDEPENQREVPPTAGRVLEALRRSIQRDLEDFLNTRRRCSPIPERLEGTLCSYGVPDLVGADLSSARRQRRFLKELERLVGLHEPRFRSIKIKAVEGASAADRTMRFRIEAVVRAEPAPESMVLNSTVEPVTRTIDVRI